jgi:uncharacterized protein (DUF1778 family)
MHHLPDRDSEKNWMEGLENNPIVLSARDFEFLLASIENPGEPNEALKQAMKNYEEKSK